MKAIKAVLAILTLFVIAYCIFELFVFILIGWWLYVAIFAGAIVLLGYLMNFLMDGVE